MKQIYTLALLQSMWTKYMIAQNSFKNDTWAIYVTPLPLFLEFPFHRTLWTIIKYSISILNISPDGNLGRSLMQMTQSSIEVWTFRNMYRDWWACPLLCNSWQPPSKSQCFDASACIILHQFCCMYFCRNWAGDCGKVQKNCDEYAYACNIWFESIKREIPFFNIFLNLSSLLSYPTPFLS